MKQTRRMKVDGFVRELSCGSFKILYSPPGAFEVGRGWNLQIWPAGKVEDGHVVHGDKVANVDWDQSDNVDILSYRSGPWEDELIALLKSETIVAFT